MGNLKPSFGKGLKRARKKAGYKTQSAFADGYHKSVETVKNWEQGKTKPSLDDFIDLCQFFECDADYLLDNLDERTHEIDFICKYTGLSAEAVELLHCITESSIKENKRTLSFLNLALSGSELKPKKDSLITTIFSQLDQYIKSRTVIRSLDKNMENPKTKEEYEVYVNRSEFESKTIMIESDGELSELISVPELYRTYKWNRIKETVEMYRKKEESKNG